MLEISEKTIDSYLKIYIFKPTITYFGHLGAADTS